MDDKYKSGYKKLIEAWGEDSQVDMCIEEMSELMKELLKYRRIKNRTNNLNDLKIRHANIQEEIADVLNTVEQMSYIFGEEEVNKIRAAKMNRALKQLSDNNGSF